MTYVFGIERLSHFSLRVMLFATLISFNNLTTEDGILKLSKEYSFVCDLSRQNGLLLSNLEQLIDDLQPGGVSGADPEAFLRVIDTKIATAMDDDLENSLIRPQTSEVDDLADVRDRYKHRFEAQMESELEKKFEREGEDDEVISVRGKGKIPLKFLRQLSLGPRNLISRLR